MKAAVRHGKETVRVADIAPRPLQPGEVRLAIEAAPTCGTDRKVFKRGYHAKKSVPPAVFGHELAGTISELRRGARNWSGKWVTAWLGQTPRRAARVFIARSGRKISVKTCCS